MNLYRITYRDNENNIGQSIIEADARRFAIAVLLDQAKLEGISRRIVEMEAPEGQVEPVGEVG